MSVFASKIATASKPEAAFIVLPLEGDFTESDPLAKLGIGQGPSHSPGLTWYSPASLFRAKFSMTNGG